MRFSQKDKINITKRNLARFALGIAVLLALVLGFKAYELFAPLPRDYSSLVNDAKGYPKLNPFPSLSNRAQSLPYPPGKDTCYYWGEGRYSISMARVYFFNDAKEPDLIFERIIVFRYIDGVIYAKNGSGALLRVDAINDEHDRYSNLRQVPLGYRPEFELLGNKRDRKNTYLD